MTDKQPTRRRYDFKSIESKWQARWDEQQLYKAPDHPDPAKKFYMLVMFAYPSGDIHMGHFRNYIIGDAVARRQMMLGKAVLHPFGWDAFGLPAERAAIQRGIHPDLWTHQNIKVSRETLQKVGISFDWTREIASCDADYYRWTQWLFLRFFEKGLAYRKRGYVNWCPEDKTVLANEQVKNGHCDRCGTLVEKKEQIQWYMKITDYADRLTDDLDRLPQWPENVKTMQREWIGRSYGVDVDFQIDGSAEKITVFTTRPDTIFGVSFVAISPESEIVGRLDLTGDAKTRVEEYKQKALLKDEIERTSATTPKDGVPTGKFAINPFSGERVEIWVADYVLAGYGTGAVMGVPAHDDRDFAFATRYSLPIRPVIHASEASWNSSRIEKAWTEYGPMVNSGEFNGLSGEIALEKLASHAQSKGFGRATKHFKLKDWSISRQRYWGCPIPIVHCPKCGEVPVPDDQLPVLLPNVDSYIPKGRSPLADVPSYMNVDCPKCGGKAERDPDTMDTFICSSWYMLRYCDPLNAAKAFEPSMTNAWMPIDLYVGGITHATGHLIYFRFFQKVLHDMGLLKDEEPATRLFNHGMVMDSHGEVMSKSKGNVVSPIGLMDERGVDVTRLAMFFTAPSELPVLWSGDSITGVEKFVMSRLYPLAEGVDASTVKLTHHFQKSELSAYEHGIYVKLNQTIKKISDDAERLQFNTNVSALMELLRDFDKGKCSSKRFSDFVVLKVIQLIAPLAPHIAEEMWETAGNRSSVFKSAWPEADPNALVADSIEIAIQVNGKLRDSIEVSSSAVEEEIVSKAKGSAKVQVSIEGKTIRKVIYVPGRLVNIVVG